MFNCENSSCQVAIIGCGISGLFAGRILKDSGMDVHLFEKSRGTGGRIATRRVGDLAFDMGAQYFTVRSKLFREYVDSWIDYGVVKQWQGRITARNKQKETDMEDPPRRYVGAPTMTAVSRYLAKGLQIEFSTLITKLIHKNHSWQLVADNGRRVGSYKNVIVATPCTQAVSLLECSSKLMNKAASVSYRPCWSVMVAFEDRLELQFDGIFLNSQKLSWAARNSSKPGRPKVESWVIHASDVWC